MNCAICKLPTGNIVGSVLPQCKCGWQAPQPPVTQRTWVGLTDEEIYAIEGVEMKYDGTGEYYLEGEYEFAKAIEAKLKDKNT